MNNFLCPVLQLLVSCFHYSVNDMHWSIISNYYSSRTSELPQTMLIKNFLEQQSRKFFYGNRATSSLCLRCNIRTRDACFVHTKVSHQVCCLQCAKEVFKLNDGRCPICFRRIEKITRNIVAWMKAKIECMSVKMEKMSSQID